MLGLVTGILGIGQSHPNNLDVGLFPVGAHGSNTGLGAYIEVSVRVKPGGLSYTPTPVAEDYVLYFRAPKSDFTTGDVIQIWK